MKSKKLTREHANYLIQSGFTIMCKEYDNINQDDKIDPENFVALDREDLNVNNVLDESYITFEFWYDYNREIDGVNCALKAYVPNQLFTVTVTETLSRNIDIYAKDKETAIYNALEKYNNEDIVLDSDDFDGVDIDINE